MIGYVYILSNPSMPGLVKIGKTTTSPSQRMQDLHSTGVPTPFELEFSAEVADCHVAERAAHGALGPYRVAENREFFNISVREAIITILPALGDYRVTAAKETYGIEKIEAELRRRQEEQQAAIREQQKKRELEERERARQNAERAAERERQEAQRAIELQRQMAQRVAALQRQLADARTRLSSLGSRPVRPEMGAFLTVLTAFTVLFLPASLLIPLYGVVGVFEGRDFGFVIVALLVAGYFAYRGYERKEAAYSQAVGPFSSIEAEITGLEAAIKNEGASQAPEPPGPIKGQDVKATVAVERAADAPVGPTPPRPIKGADILTIVAVCRNSWESGGTERVSLPNGRTLDVQIPAGVQEGTKLRLRGQGHHSPNGGEPGDVLAMVMLNFQSHPPVTPDNLQTGRVAKFGSDSQKISRVTADAVDPLGQFDLGRRYEEGRDGFPQDYREAARLYKLAADGGSVAAKCHLGHFYEQGRGGLEPDCRAAARLYKLAVEGGDVSAFYDLGRFYEDGLGGISTDLQEAMRLYQLGADRGNQLAQTALLRCAAAIKHETVAPAGPTPPRPIRGDDMAATVVVSRASWEEGGTERVVLPSGRILDVKIPAGVQEGSKLRLRGEGRPAPNGGEPGDALVTVMLKFQPPPPRASRAPEPPRLIRGQDIEATVIIPRNSWQVGRASPMSQQRAMANFWFAHRRGFNLSDVGTPKIAAALWAVDYLMLKNEIRKVLVLCRISDLEQVWAQELATILPHRSFSVLHGPVDLRLKRIAEGADFLLLNHDGVKIQAVASALRQMPDLDLIIVDEGHFFANAATDLYKALRSILRPDQRLWWQTATPAADRPTQAWAQARLVNPENVTPYPGVFERRTMIREHGRWVARPEAEEMVFAALQPAIRVRKADCFDLPPLVRTSEHQASVADDQPDALGQMQREWRMTKTVTLPTGRVLDVQIPAWVEEGSRLRLRGEGLPSPNGGEPGDALVTVKFQQPSLSPEQLVGGAESLRESAEQESTPERKAEPLSHSRNMQALSQIHRHAAPVDKSKLN